MAIDGKLMAKARERLEAIKANNEKLQEERMLEVYTRVPEVRRIDAALRALMGEIISASLKKGEAAKREIEAISEKSLLLCGEKAEALWQRDTLITIWTMYIPALCAATRAIPIPEWPAPA